MKQKKRLFAVIRAFDNFYTTTWAVSEKQAINQVAYREAQKYQGGIGSYRDDDITIDDYEAIPL